MPVPNYGKILDSEIDPESPITSSLMTRLRDNLLAIIGVDNSTTGPTPPKIKSSALETIPGFNYKKWDTPGTYNYIIGTDDIFGDGNPAGQVGMTIFVEAVGGGGGGQGMHNTGFGCNPVSGGNGGNSQVEIVSVAVHATATGGNGGGAAVNPSSPGAGTTGNILMTRGSAGEAGIALIGVDQLTQGGAGGASIYGAAGAYGNPAGGDYGGGGMGGAFWVPDGGSPYGGAGSGGGAGGHAHARLTLTNGDTLRIIVGAGGAGGGGSSPGGAGGRGLVLMRW